MAQRIGLPNEAQTQLLAALRGRGRSKPIDAHEHAHGKVPPASRGGVASAAARELRTLMSQGYVNAVYWDNQPERGVLYHLTAAGWRAAAGQGPPGPPPRPTPRDPSPAPNPPGRP